MINDKKAYKKLKDSCKKIKKTNTLDTFYEAISKIGKANYKDIKPLNDSHSQIIKKIDKKRKESIKENKRN